MVSCWRNFPILVHAITTLLPHTTFENHNSRGKKTAVSRRGTIQQQVTKDRQEPKHDAHVAKLPVSTNQIKGKANRGSHIDIQAVSLSQMNPVAIPADGQHGEGCRIVEKVDEEVNVQKEAETMKT